MTTSQLSRGLGALTWRMDRMMIARAERRRLRHARRFASKMERLDVHTMRDIGLLDGTALRHG